MTIEGIAYILRKLEHLAPLHRDAFIQRVTNEDAYGIDYIVRCLNVCVGERSVLESYDGELTLPHLVKKGIASPDEQPLTEKQRRELEVLSGVATAVTKEGVWWEDKAARYLKACKRMHQAWLREREHRCYEQERGYRMRREARNGRSMLMKEILELNRRLNEYVLGVTKMDNIDPSEYGKNLEKPTMDVHHSALPPVSDSSVFRVHCPACDDGMLLVRRNNKTLQLEELDSCLVCGQVVRYLDIEELRKKYG